MRRFGEAGPPVGSRNDRGLGVETCKQVGLVKSRAVEGDGSPDLHICVTDGELRVPCSLHVSLVLLSQPPSCPAGGINNHVDGADLRKAIWCFYLPHPSVDPVASAAAAPETEDRISTFWQDITATVS